MLSFEKLTAFIVKPYAPEKIKMKKSIKSKVRKKLGLLRSVAMYYWKPFNHRRLTGFYRQFVCQGDLCYDIGAHLGNRTAAWRALGARVISVEPQPQCLAYLRNKFGKDPDVHILPRAVGAEPGKAMLYISQLTPTISTLSGAQWQKKMNNATSFEVYWDETVEVEVVTLDQLIETHGMPDFCKIDVEDFEWQVLQGLSHALPCLSLEYFIPTLDRIFDCIDRLEELGNYAYNWSFGESQVLNSEEWLGPESLKKILKNYTDQDRSGDIYARLIKKDAP